MADRGTGSPQQRGASLCQERGCYDIFYLEPELGGYVRELA